MTSMTTPFTRSLRLGAVIAGVALAAGCATDTPQGGDNIDPEVTELPTPQPGDGELTTAALAMVLDPGSGPELCLGAIAESYPPQCSGPAIIGWTWPDDDDAFDEASGVQWGTFRVTGTYDAEAAEFTLTEAVPSDGSDGPPPTDDNRLSTLCPEPDGGWQVEDTSLVSERDMQSAFDVASELDGYAAAWVDQSPNPAGTPDVEGSEEDEARWNDPLFTIVNVRVTHDADAAEAALREVWSGMLCVSEATYTEAELEAILDDIGARGDLLSAGVDGITGTVQLSVVFDDGQLQATANERYGDGVVVVNSALVPVVD